MKMPDPLSFFVWLAGLVVGSHFSQVVAPYLMIVTLCTSTALVALGRRDPAKPVNGFVFLIAVNGIAIGATTLLATMISANIESVEDRALLAPIALVIGFIGLDWPKVLPTIWSWYVQWKTGGTGGTK